ncbi:Uncharacterised protein [uncultured Eubacterium sp.]|uniref:DUF7666 domain-containing protein n=1 Tax=Brotomerdimonas butyrica TaxID=2981721 RepID=UPI0008219729|nr:hypothetical protein [Brotomerdimonas butyrica]MCU6756415.1 hypothetical protein [Brotomerdimonas butyrica]SCH82738.1 Uncharacterised protein [uncultured Eubacterium sp.]
MKAYKGFNNKLQCREFQYKVGETYEEEKAELCNCGFHACEAPLDVFGYYPPADSRYCEVELEDVSEKTSDDSKRCARKISIGAEIGIKGIVEAGVKFIMDKVDWNGAKESNTGYGSAATNTGDRSAATNTGYGSAATNTGYGSAATNTGDRSAATNTGDGSAATNTGYGSAATNTGDRSAAIVEGKESIAIATGIEGKAKGALGCFIVLAEWCKDGNYEWHIKDVKSAVVDGETIKANTFYMLKDGEFTEVE